MVPAIAEENVTELLRAHVNGDKCAGEILLPKIQSELRRLARNRLRMERVNHTFKTTDLVHEAYAKIFGGAPVEFADRSHFFALAALNMRRILVDYAKKRIGQAHGYGDTVPFELLESKHLDVGTEESWVRVMAVHQALERMEKIHPQHARLVEMKFFAEMTEEAIAEVLGKDERTVRRYWTFAQNWLKLNIGAPPATSEE